MTRSSQDMLPILLLGVCETAAAPEFDWQGAPENNKNGRASPYAVAFRSSLYSSHQDQNNNDDQDDPERPAGIVAPAA
jgi:hypothetical protein